MPLEDNGCSNRDHLPDSELAVGSDNRANQCTAKPADSTPRITRPGGIVTAGSKAACIFAENPSDPCASYGTDQPKIYSLVRGLVSCSSSVLES